MEPCNKSLPLNYHPQQKEFIFDRIKFTSKFDSGNLFNVDKVDDTTFNLYISPDCYGKENSYSYRTWFYYGVINSANSEINFNICNMNNQSKMFKDGYRIVYRVLKENEILDRIETEYTYDEELTWKRLKNPIYHYCQDDKKQLKISFNYKFEEFEKYGVLFSFCYPWSYTKNLKFLDYVQNLYEANSLSYNNNLNFNCKKQFYFHKEILTYSKERRIVSLITLSSYDGITKNREKKLKNMFPEIGCDRAYTFSKHKPIIFISARVHPGETSSSYLANGIIKFLTSPDPRAEILRKLFVFKIIPMINVDGVYRGFYRHDTNSLNMNRHYSNPNKKTQPEIFALRNLFLFYSSEFSVRYYLDLHGHVSSKGLFLFGNSLEYLQQVENCVLPKIMEINSEYFSLDHCIFSERSMKSIDKGDKFTKEGTGRVYLHKCTNLIHSYTIEASCFRGIKNVNTTNKESKFDNIIGRNVKEFYEDKSEYKNSEEVQDEVVFYTPYSYEKMGISILISIIDYEEKNPFTKIGSSDCEFKNVGSIRHAIANRLLKEDEKYKGNIYYQNLARDIEGFNKYTPLNLNYNEKSKNSHRKETIISRLKHGETRVGKSSTNAVSINKSSFNLRNLNKTENLNLMTNPNNQNINNLIDLNKKLSVNEKDLIDNIIKSSTGRVIGINKIKATQIHKEEIKYIIFPNIQNKKG